MNCQLHPGTLPHIGARAPWGGVDALDANEHGVGQKQKLLQAIPSGGSAVLLRRSD